MKEKLVRQFRCEHCNKKMYQRPAMAKHELHCTMNPRRECGVCEMLQEVQYPIEVMTALFPEPLENIDYATSKWDEYRKECQAALKELEKITQCPACILSALRQSKTTESGYDYKDMMRGVMDQVNEDRNANYAGGC